MKWQNTITTASETEVAIRELTHNLQGASPDILFLFSSMKESASLLKNLSLLFPKAQIVGCSGGGIIGHIEEEKQPASSLTAGFLPDVNIQTFSLSKQQTSKTNPINWEEKTQIHPDLQPCFILFLDPLTCNTPFLLNSIDKKTILTPPK